MTAQIKLYELIPVDFEMLQYFKGTRQTFGLISALTTISPLFNTIKNWKHRGKSLIIDERAFIKLATKDGVNINDSAGE